MFGIPFGMPVQQVLVGTQQEGTGTAGRVEDLETGGFLAGSCLREVSRRYS